MMTNVFASLVLHIDDAGHKNTGVADDHPAGLEHQLGIEPLCNALHHLRIGRRLRRIGQIVLVGNAEATAEIDVRDGVAIRTQRADEFHQQFERIFHRPQIGDLAADMHVDTGDLDAGQLCRARIDITRMSQRNTELVFGLAR